MKHRDCRAAKCSMVVLALLVGAAAARWAAAADGGEDPREVGRLRLKQLDEVSGIVASRVQPDVLWMHNDGDAKYVYAVRPSGQLVARVRLRPGIRDLEDIAIGPGPQAGRDYLYLGDIGDNDERRPEIRVWRFAEPIVGSVPEARLSAADVDEFRLSYPDGPHNAEAMMVDPRTGDLLIVTKEKRRARVYAARADSLNSKASTTLEKVAVIDCRYVSGGDISRDGSLVVLRRESRGWLWHRRDGESIPDALGRGPQEIPVRCAGQALNGEAIALGCEGRGYYTISEGKQQPICLFSLARAAADGESPR